MPNDADLSSAMDTLKNMLSSKDGQDQIQNILSAFNAQNSSQSNDDASHDNSSDYTQSHTFANNQNMDQETAEMFFKLQKVMTELNFSKSSKEADFLRALSFMLKGNKKQKLDNAVKILGMGRVIKILKDM